MPDRLTPTARIAKTPRSRVALLLGLLGPLCPGPGLAADPAQVKTAAVGEVAIFPERSAPATVVSLNEARIASQLAARVTELPVKVGDVVDAGATLVRLECDDYTLRAGERGAQLNALDARLALAQRRVERTRELRDKRSAAEDLFDERLADVAVLKAERAAAGNALAMARTDAARCEIKSPFRALVLERQAAVGDYAQPGTGLLRILDLDNIEVSAEVPVDDVRQLELVEGMVLETTLGRYPVRMRRVVAAVNTAARNQEVRLEFTDTSALAGSAGQLKWRDVRPHIPSELLVRRGEQFGVFADEAGVARFKALPGAQPGRVNPTEFRPSTRLVIEGQYSLQDADPIATVN
ncbi:MAG: efflux RND transporter periplasmic adaptor subunit [Gammaproteobacteria bacterium]|nr:efflux RND transporter periplasmic adaptor subunit [Gammaproteobacteria bacterium]